MDIDADRRDMADLQHQVDGGGNPVFADDDGWRTAGHSLAIARPAGAQIGCGRAARASRKVVVPR